MEEVERGVGGTGNKTRVGARGRILTDATLARGIGKVSKRLPPALLPEGSLGGKTTDGRGLTAPVCERDGDARPHHANRALSAVQIRSRAQKPPAPPWAETTAMATGDAPTPDGRTRVICRCVLGFIHPRSGGITATSSSTTVGWTGAKYEEPLT